MGIIFICKVPASMYARSSISANLKTQFSSVKESSWWEVEFWFYIIMIIVLFFFIFYLHSNQWHKSIILLIKILFMETARYHIESQQAHTHTHIHNDWWWFFSVRINLFGNQMKQKCGWPR